jgi:tetratricopeptide (TPR) repeat protein
MARELNVNYFVEGSGQKIGDQILLNIQLIDANSDNHLWAGQYRREAKDIFELQQEVAQKIAMEIQAIITAAERQQIEKVPTKNLEAYDLYLKGRDLSYVYALGNTPELGKAIDLFQQAIALDPEFALAYASAAMNYYYLDLFQVEKKYQEDVAKYADKAILYDPNLTESLMAKALAYIQAKEYNEAVPYLEKALEYSPNSPEVIGFLSDFYLYHIPNTSRYLEYALMGVRLDVAAQDSVNVSYNYLRLGNALMMTGFIDEALTYVDKSLEYNPKNPFSGYLRAYVVFAKDRDMAKLRSGSSRRVTRNGSRWSRLQASRTSATARRSDVRTSRTGWRSRGGRRTKSKSISKPSREEGMEPPS